MPLSSKEDYFECEMKHGSFCDWKKSGCVTINNCNLANNSKPCNFCTNQGSKIYCNKCVHKEV